MSEAAPGAAWSVYVLRCGDGTLYTGATNDLARRVAAHACGKGARYTRSRLPVRLVYEERAGGRGAALRREAALKRLTRAEKLALVRAHASAREGRGRRVGRPPSVQPGHVASLAEPPPMAAPARLKRGLARRDPAR